MPTLKMSDHSIEVDSEGYLCNLDDWSKETAESIAINDGIQLSSNHWEIINLLRGFYAEYQISPAMRILVKQAKNQLGNDKGSSIYLLTLFPGSPAKLASKIAGLPKPTNCL